MNIAETYMHRCLELARLGAGHVAPNPMVGAVLVHKDRIIGEGWHRQYGQAHAEVNCIHSVKEEDLPLIQQSTLYVSLEPCAHFGKTPPCADLIIVKKIPRVVIGCRDPFEEVNGKGIEKLRAAGVEVELGVLEKECIHLNRRFFTFNTLHRPYILLKWAQSSDGKLAPEDRSRVFISNEYTNRLVHRWRTEEASILVGTNTALYDDPALTARLWKGPDPIRLVLDKDLRLPQSLRLFDRKVRTIIFNTVEQGEADGHWSGGRAGEGGSSGSAGGSSDGADGSSGETGKTGGTDDDSRHATLSWYKLTAGSSLIPQLVQALYQLRIQSVLVEGGATLLQAFISEGYWDEARVITNEDLYIGEGLSAPVMNGPQLISREQFFSDTLCCYTNPAADART
ncbi:MAG TPA: bifunctional diaminohydroxyphosphoribosylaminopyrimidine deaminase/5-amino-6-(5-phosphoribosylamino)uracil reductase RibD [Puia sp.]|nr:bifunctional diaminohydroxyphosphoribosylaminopyrimidine deaminase/5-amino-6-(5-phosphoribosylamino)uracil reductase RibD [Puia sp.]